MTSADHELFQSHPDAMWICQPADGRILAANPAARTTFGYPEARFLQMTLDDLCADDAAQSGQVRLRRADGMLLPATLLNVAVEHEGRAAKLVIARGVATTHDALERLRVERELAAVLERLRVSEERFRIVAQSADLVWDWNLADDTVWRSEGLPSLFDDELRAGTIEAWRSRLHPQDRERVVAEIAAVVSGAEMEWLDEYRFRRLDGSWAWIKDQGSVIRDEAGCAVRMVGSTVDATEQRALEERLQRSQRLDAIGQLTGGVAHDFNNLLTVIIGNADVLVERLRGDPPLQSVASMTRSAAERGAELTRRLLAFARRQTLDPRVTDVNALVRGMYGLLHRTLGEQIDIELSCTEDLWQAIVDASQLESALLNLCLNARDAMPRGGRLVVDTANVHLGSDDRIHRGAITAGDYATITVSDTGTGMAAEIIEHVFEPFFTTKEIGKGSGLGLSMVYGFIKQSSGHVRIHSDPGAGTAVTLYLPRAEVAATTTGRGAGSPAMVGGSERILLVEDDDVVRMFVASQLQDLGYQVVTAANGPQALRLLHADEFDLLFTDVVMPGGMNGRELADAARVAHPELPVLFTSGYAEDAIGLQDRLDARVQLLHKPYRRAELAAKVRQVLTHGHNGD